MTAFILEHAGAAILILSLILILMGFAYGFAKAKEHVDAACAQDGLREEQNDKKTQETQGGESGSGREA